MFTGFEPYGARQDGLAAIRTTKIITTPSKTGKYWRPLPDSTIIKEYSNEPEELLANIVIAPLGRHGRLQ